MRDKKKAEKLENRPIRKINCHRRTTVGEGEYSTDLLTARSQSVATGEADLLVKHERRESEERKEYLQLEQPPFDHSDHGWSAGSTGRSSFGRSSRIRGPNGRPPPPTVTTSRVRGRHERHSQGIWLRQTVIIDDDISRERYHRTTLSPHTTGARARYSTGAGDRRAHYAYKTDDGREPNAVRPEYRPTTDHPTTVALS